jgi:polysaccharide biosynthesis transport protein
MAQLLESLSNRATSVAGPEAAAVEPHQSIDILKILWRWKWLPVLGALIGGGTGYMFFTKLPEQFESIALIQVTSNVPASTDIDLYDADKVGFFTNRGDESRAIKSTKVLGLAVQVGKLSKHFPEMADDEIISELRDPDIGVEVLPAEKSERSTTQQLFISYKCYDPEKARAVVDAVISGYQAFLKEEYKTVDEEVLNFFASTEKRLDQRYKDLFQEHQRFREEAPNVLWNSEDAVDPFAESYVRLKAQLEDVRIRRTKLRGTLQQVAEAQRAERRSEDILVMLNEGSETAQSNLLRQIYAEERYTNLESDKLERDFLIPLRAQEQQLLGNYGAAHPTIQAIRREINALEERVAATRRIEELERLEKEKLYQKSVVSTEERKSDPLFANSGLSGAAEILADATVGESSADLVDQVSQGAMLGSIASEISRAELMAAHLLDVRLNALREHYLAMERHEQDLSAMAEEELRKSQELQQFLQKNAWLKDQVASVKEMLNSFSEKVRAVELVPTNVNQRVLKELDPASPGLPAGPFAIRYVFGGAALGLLLMSGLAILMDLADRSYRSPDEIVADLGRPVLGHIPAMEVQNLKKVVDSVDASIITLHHSRGRIAEAYRSVRTCLFFSNRASELKVIQVTSPVPGDGKSTLSANLAVAMAQSGRRVLLIDADFRRPRQQKLFGIDAKVGMAQVLGGKAELDDATYGSCVANLSIMPGGQHPSNPAELLSSSRFAELIDVLREKYDIIVVDTPPVLAVSDPSVVAAVADGVVVTMRLRRNVKPLASRTFSILEAVNANVLGVVVNGVSTEAAYGGYGYSYSYNDYRDSYRYEGKSYGYGKYAEYSAGYIEDKQSDEPMASDVSNDNRP